MPLQNRVDPWGTLTKHSSRSATLMGNRGIIHNKDKEIISKWKSKAWIACLKEFGNIKREVFSEGSYSELFFLDEATAFSAGHRPCAFCQRQRFNDFISHWRIGNNIDGEIKAPEIDKQIHNDRVTAGKEKNTFQERLGNLPIGTFFERSNLAILIESPGRFLVWSFDGYLKALEISDDVIVNVLTPASIVNTFKSGFVPKIHDSAKIIKP